MKKIKLFNIFFITIVILFLICFGLSKLDIEKTPVIDNNSTDNVTVQPVQKDERQELLDKLDEYENINVDFLGLLNVGNSLCEDEVIVSSASNEEYIHKDFYTSDYSIYGTSWMDFRNDFDNDQNIIIYGHYVYPEKWDDEHICFTYLHELKDKNNYEDNKTITLTTKDGIREYVVALIYYINEYENFAPYYMTEYDDIQSYVTQAKESEFYDTGVEINDGDKLISLQTCVENRSELRLIVVGKEVNRIDF